MRIGHRLIGTTGLLVLTLLLPGIACAAGITGYWRTPAKHGDAAVIHIYREGEVFNGRVAALSQPRYPADADNGHAGEAKMDLHNPEKSLRDRPIIGLEIVHGFETAGDGEWDDATIYNPNNGKTYKCTAKLTDGGQTLEVRGYIGISLFGHTQEWTRVPGPDIFGKRG